MYYLHHIHIHIHILIFTKTVDSKFHSRPHQRLVTLAARKSLLLLLLNRHESWKMWYFISSGFTIIFVWLFVHYSAHCTTSARQNHRGTWLGMVFIFKTSNALKNVIMAFFYSKLDPSADNIFKFVTFIIFICTWIFV